MFLLVYNDADEPITQVILNRSDKLGDELISISVAELLDDIEIFDQIEDGEASLRWTLPNGRILTNGSDVKLINRVTAVSPDLFASFHPEDRDYASQEFWAYLSFALESFKQKTASPCFLGLAGPNAPLPYQWFKAAQIGLKVPSYYLGARGMMPFAADNPKLVNSSAYNYFSWKPNVSTLKQSHEADYDENKHIFVFERPEGSPVSVFIAGDQVAINMQSISAHLDKELIVAIAQKIAQCFDVHFAEVLLFATEDQITFGTLVLVPTDRIASLEEFAPLVTESLCKWGQYVPA